MIKYFENDKKRKGVGEEKGNREKRKGRRRRGRGKKVRGRRKKEEGREEKEERRREEGKMGKRKKGRGGEGGKGGDCRREMGRDRNYIFLHHYSGYVERTLHVSLYL